MSMLFWLYCGLAFFCLLSIILITGLEYSWLTSNAITIELKKKQGKKSGKLLGYFFEKPEVFWRSTTIGFYIVIVSFGYLFTKISTGTVGLIYRLYPQNLFVKYLYHNEYAQMVADLILATLIVLFFIGVIGKRIFERNPEGKLKRWSPVLAFFATLISPIAVIFTGISEFILKYLFDVRVSKKETIFERINIEKFKQQTMQGHEPGEEVNKELFGRALRLTQTKVRQCITPRNEVAAVDVSDSVETLKEKFIATKLSKIVVYDGSLDNIVGYTHHLDINRKPTTIREILHPIPVVPETMNAIDLMRLFSKERKSIAWVVDEFGGTFGFIAMDDVLEEIFGNIKDEYDIEEYTDNQIAEHEYLFSGRLKISYLNEKYGLDFPTNIAETLSGYIISQYETIPRQKERIIIGNMEFEILLVTETKIETVKMRVLKY